MTASSSHSNLAGHLASVARETLGDETDWTIAETDDGYELLLPEECLRIDRAHSPDDATRWVVTHRADGSTVGKSGPYESIERVEERLLTLLTSDVRYTVCCDG